MSFGPGSMLYETYGDRAGMLLAPAEGMMQLMYPALGRGVVEHSDFYNEPWDRLFRSVPQIQGMIFDGDLAGSQALTVRDFHKDIKGEFDDGSRYHALDPETFFWAHATFIDAVFRTTDLYWRKPMTHEQRVAVYAEGIEWWQMYGLSMRVVPRTYEDFLDYWNHHVGNVLEVTPAAQGLVDFLNDPSSMNQPWVPSPVWRALSPLGRIPLRDISVGAMPPHVRELLGFRWTRAHQAGFEAFRLGVATAWPLLPERIRIMPRARAAYRRQGRLGVHAALSRAHQQQHLAA